MRGGQRFGNGGRRAECHKPCSSPLLLAAAAPPHKLQMTPPSQQVGIFTWKAGQRVQPVKGNKQVVGRLMSCS